MKFIGALIVIIAFGLIGLTIGRNFKRRPEELRALQGSLQLLETEIVYGATPLPEAFNRIAKLFNTEIGRIFDLCKENLRTKNGMTIQVAWEAALDAQYQHTSLAKGDIEVLRSLGTALGMSDRNDQQKHIRLAIGKLQTEEKRAIDDAQKYAKTWNYLGFLCGLTLVILIF